MRDLIALRAKIDLMQKEQEEKISNCGDPHHTQFLIGTCVGYENIRQMIDDMVGKQLEAMYAEHIQEEAEADRH